MCVLPNLTNKDIVTICENKYKGSLKYGNSIKLTNPGYLHYLCYATVNVKGLKIIFLS